MKVTKTDYILLYNINLYLVSGEITFPAFRVSAIAPINIPIVFGMLACPPSNVAGTLLLHWVNQSYNSACNYANRSRGGGQDMTQIGTSYALAVRLASTCYDSYVSHKEFLLICIYVNIK